jgi:hypothetical protein
VAALGQQLKQEGAQIHPIQSSIDLTLELVKALMIPLLVANP